MESEAVKRNNSLLFGIGVGVIIGIIVAVLVMVLSRPIRPAAIEIQAPQPTAPLPTAAPLPTETPAMLHVYITGAVSVPDVYELPPGSIVKDAIVMAGGFTAEADEVVVNQALRLQDEDHIHVPAVGETAEVPTIIRSEIVVPVDAPDDSGGAAGTLININTASKGELESLPGIGPSLAQNIIDYRETTGPFETIEEIMEVSGIGEAKFGAVQDLITVGN